MYFIVHLLEDLKCLLVDIPYYHQLHPLHLAIFSTISFLMLAYVLIIEFL